MVHSFPSSSKVRGNSDIQNLWKQLKKKPWCHEACPGFQDWFMGQLDSVEKTVWLVTAQPEQHGKEVWPLAKYTPGNSALKHYIGAGNALKHYASAGESTETLYRCWGIHWNIIGAGKCTETLYRCWGISAGTRPIAKDKKGNSVTKDSLGINRGALIKSQGSEAKRV